MDLESGFLLLLETEGENYRRIRGSTTKHISRFSVLWNFFSRKKSRVFHSVKEQWKKKKTYCLGIFTLILVVLTVSTIISSLSHLDVVNFVLAENEASQSDIIIESKDEVEKINYTRFEENILEVSSLEGNRYSLSSPRHILKSTDVISLKTCKLRNHNINELDVLYDLFEDNSTHNCQERKVGLYIIDFSKEKKMGLGRAWSYEKPKKGEVMISKLLSSMLSVGVGDTILLSFEDPSIFYGAFSKIESTLETPLVKNIDDFTNLDDSLKIVIKNNQQNLNNSENEQSEELSFPWRVVFPMKISIVVEDFYGKFASFGTLTEIAIMEYKYFFQHISNYLHPLIKESYSRKLSKMNPEEYSSYIYINHPERLELYTSSSSISKAEEELIKFGGSLNYFLGFPHLKLNYPLLNHLSKMDMVSMILSLIIFVIIFIVSVISSALLYMLFKFNFEERKSEFSVLRMLGIKLSGISELIWIEALLYIVPGVLLGVLLSQFLFMFLSQLLKWGIGSSLPNVRSTLTYESIIVAVIIGTFIPIISSISPIRNIKKGCIGDLNGNNKRVKSPGVNEEKVRKSTSSISSTELVVGLFGGIFGILMYLVLPHALITMNISLLLGIFLSLLLLMMFGLILVFLNVVVIVEYIILRLFIQPWENGGVVRLIRKFLISHRKKNIKVTLIFSVSIACVMFISVSFRLQKDMNSFRILREYGGVGMVIKHLGNWNDNENTKEERIQGLYRMKRDFEGLMSDLEIESYSYITFPLSHMLYDYKSIYLKNIGGTKSVEGDLSGISGNLYELLDDTFLKIKDVWKGFESVSDQLYSLRGSHSVLLGSNLKYKLGLTRLTDNLIMIVNDGRDVPKDFLIRPNSFLSSGSSASFSKFRQERRFSMTQSYGNGEDVFCSFPFFMKVLEQFRESYFSNSSVQFSSMDDLPIQTIFIRHVDDVKIYNYINKNITQMLQRYNLHESRILNVNELKHFNLMENMMDMILYFSTSILLVLSFFSLSSEMWSNIRNQKKEIGILRSMGLKRFKLFRLFLGETFVLVTSSLIFGVSIGVIIGYSLVVQQSQFSQLPVSFVFPWGVFIVTFIGGMLISMLSTCLIMFCGLRKSITYFLK